MVNKLTLIGPIDQNQYIISDDFKTTPSLVLLAKSMEK